MTTPRKRGRPKTRTEPGRKIGLMLPESILTKLDKLCYRGPEPSVPRSWMIARLIERAAPTVYPE